MREEFARDNLNLAENLNKIMRADDNQDIGNGDNKSEKSRKSSKELTDQGNEISKETNAKGNPQQRIFPTTVIEKEKKINFKVIKKRDKEKEIFITNNNSSIRKNSDIAINNNYDKNNKIINNTLNVNVMNNFFGGICDVKDYSMLEKNLELVKEEDISKGMIGNINVNTQTKKYTSQNNLDSSIQNLNNSNNIIGNQGSPKRKSIKKTETFCYIDILVNAADKLYKAGVFIIDSEVSENNTKGLYDGNIEKGDEQMSDEGSNSNNYQQPENFKSHQRNILYEDLIPNRREKISSECNYENFSPNERKGSNKIKNPNKARHIARKSEVETQQGNVFNN
jgi:hypothetical protein